MQEILRDSRTFKSFSGLPQDAGAAAVGGSSSSSSSETVGSGAGAEGISKPVLTSSPSASNTSATSTTNVAATGTDGADVLLGFSWHGPRQYLYRYDAPGAPSLELWVSEPGKVSGTIAGVAR